LSATRPQNSHGTGVHDGRFQAGRSGNPGGRPRGLARRTRELVGEDGDEIVRFWLALMRDETAKTADRLEASRLLAVRGWGKPAAFELVEDDDPLGLDDERREAAVIAFDAEVRRLASLHHDAV
jgi:hypothetical protein